MPFIPVTATVEVELRYLLDDQHIENTLYFELTGTPAADSMLNLLNGVESWWIDNMAPIMPTAVSLVELVATSLSSATGPQVTVAPVGGDLGLVPQEPLPNNCSLAVSFRTALRGRSFRGRNYVPALGEGQVAGNIVSPGVVTALQDAYTQILTMVTTLDEQWDWVVVSRYSGVDSDGKPIPRVAGVTTPVTTVVIVDPVIDSMRRRLPGRGR
jgi:hypothetical protein